MSALVFFAKKPGDLITIQSLKLIFQRSRLSSKGAPHNLVTKAWRSKAPEKAPTRASSRPRRLDGEKHHPSMLVAHRSSLYKTPGQARTPHRSLDTHLFPGHSVLFLHAIASVHGFLCSFLCFLPPCCFTLLLLSWAR